MANVQKKIPTYLLDQLKKEGYKEHLIQRVYSDLGYSEDYNNLKGYLDCLQPKSPKLEKEFHNRKTINNLKNDFKPPEDIYEMEDQIEKAIKLSKQEAGSHDRPDKLIRQTIGRGFTPAAIRNRKNST